MEFGFFAHAMLGHDGHAAHHPSSLTKVGICGVGSWNPGAAACAGPKFSWRMCLYHSILSSFYVSSLCTLHFTFILAMQKHDSDLIAVLRSDGDFGANPKFMR